MAGVGEQPGGGHWYDCAPPAAMCRMITETRSCSSVERFTVHNERSLSHYERFSVWIKASMLCCRRPSTRFSVPAGLA